MKPSGSRKSRKPARSTKAYDDQRTIWLENETLRLEFDREHGRLIGLWSVVDDWAILDRPDPGLSFRLLAPLRGRRNNPVHGEKQKTARVEVREDHRGATFFWDGVTSEHGGFLDIKLKLTVTLDDRQAVFALEVDNRSTLTIENVYFPYLGDVQRPKDAKWFKTFLSAYSTAQQWSLWPRYNNMKGYWGVDFPTQLGGHSTCGAPMSPFILLRSQSRGLYVGVASPDSELVVWQTELHPGFESCMEERAFDVTKTGAQDVFTRFAAIHLPFILPGETRTLTPVALECFHGGWQKGADIYKLWRGGWMKMPEAPAWTKEPHSWQQIHINSPEDELRYRFTDLVRIGEDCARHGVKAIQLVGWNDGGQDQGNPSHDPDPRLGTFEELQRAIANIQAMGVKVVLFAKFTWADRETERYRKELFRLAVKDPYGDPYFHPGYQYQSVTQLLDMNTKRFAPMCFLSDEYLKVCREEFSKMVALGADGILFDECLHHGNALVCFDSNHGHRYAANVYANDRALVEMFSSIARSANPDFLFAGEACYDWQFEAYHLSYTRSWDKGHVPLQRYLLPDAPLATAVTGFNDRNMINQCLLYRYIASYEPYNFKGRLDDFPLTMAYGKRMDALRTELREYLWDGEFRHEVGATVTSGGKPHHPYSVFLSRKSGRSCVVVANYDDSARVTVRVKRDDAEGAGRYRLVDAPRWRSAKNGVALPPRSAAVIVD